MKNKNIMFSPGLGIRSFRFHAIRTFFRSFSALLLFSKRAEECSALSSFFEKRERTDCSFHSVWKERKKSGKKSGALFLTTFWRKTPFFTENPGFLVKTWVFCPKFLYTMYTKKSGSLFRSFQKEWKERIALFKKSGKSGSLFLKWGKS